MEIDRLRMQTKLVGWKCVLLFIKSPFYSKVGESWTRAARTECDVR